MTGEQTLGERIAKSQLALGRDLRERNSVNSDDLSPSELERVSRARASWASAVQARGTRYGECQLGNFRCECDEQAKAVQKLKEFGEQKLAANEGENLIFVGPVGTGKDHLLFASLKYATHGLRKVVAWRNGLDLYGAFRDGIANGDTESSILKELQRPDILAISDPVPPSGALTEYQSAMLYRIIDNRYSNYKQTWMTINAKDRSEMESRIGVATVDRLLHGATVIKCNWPSFRRTAK